MNAAARLVHQNVLIRHLVITSVLTKKQLFMLLLLVWILISSISVIYITNCNRSLYAIYQQNLIERNYLQNQHSQLLLERSTILRQSRVEQYAERNLGMMLPTHENRIIIIE